MNVKRRDSKNRVLRNGENQRKDGRYAYVYLDNKRKQQFIYSWKLEATDRIPQGKRNCTALRDKIKEINKRLDSGISPDGGSLTVLDLVKKYISQKTGVKHNTEANYNFITNIIKKEDFGYQRIDRVKLSDAKAWLIKLQADGRGYSTIHSVRSVVRPAFQLAVDDDLIRKNPFEFRLATVVVNDSVTREAITKKEERMFLEFIKNDSHYSRYYEGFFILFKTGLRISEFAGLTYNDIDFKNNRINIDHQLQRKRNREYIIESTKTTSGTRLVPMSEEVKQCFETILANRKKTNVEPMVDGKSGFLYLDRKNMPMVASHWENYFKCVLAKYDKTYKIQLPQITPHVCRHTFCSNMARSGMNPKTLQYIMGHSNISVTLNTYTHVGFEDAQKEMLRVCNQ